MTIYGHITIMMDTFKILQTNVQSLRCRVNELQYELTKEKYDAALISETWTNGDVSRKFNITNYNKIIKSRHDGYGGVAIYIAKDHYWQHIDINDLNSVETVAVFIPKLKMALVSVYIAPNSTRTETFEELKIIFEKLKDYPKVMIGGDFNGKHQIWGNDLDDTRGRDILEAMSDSDLIILNNGQMTHYPTDITKRASAIDLTIGNPEIFMNTTWEVLNRTLGSAHHIVQITVNLESNPTPQKYTINKKKLMEKVINLNCDEVNNLDELQTKFKELYKECQVKVTYQPKYYWNEEMSDIYEKLQEAIKKFKMNSNAENIIEVNKLQCAFKNKKKKFQRKKIEDLHEEISPQSTTSVMWKKIGILSGKFKKKNGLNVIQETKEKAHEFIKLNFDGAEQITDHENHNQENGEPDQVRITQNQVTEKIMDQNKLESILNRKKAKSAPGTDGITYEYIKKLPGQIKTKIIEDINRIWQSGKIPSYLLDINVIAIPKPHKNLEESSSYRPISLLQCITKVINSAVLDKLQDHLQVNHIIPDSSFGFRRKSSTITCINYVLNSIASNKRKAKVSIITFIDFSRAFNTVKPSTLEQIMVREKIPNTIISWIKSFLNNRKIIIESERSKFHFSVKEGLPQGDVLSPTLFNLYTADFHRDRDEDTTVGQFADDIAIVTSGPNISIAMEKMQDELNKIVDIANRLNLQVNPEKTKYMVLSNETHQSQLIINNKAIQIVDKHIYLGIVIDNKLSFKPHIENLIGRINEKQNMLKVISSLKNGAHPQTLGNIHNALINSIIEYGSSIYGNATKTVLNKLENCSRNCLRMISGCAKSTPVHIVRGIMAKEPLDIKREFTVAKEVAKNIQNNEAIRKQLEMLPQIEIKNSRKFTYLEKIYMRNREKLQHVYPLVENRSQKAKIKTEIEGLKESKNKLNPNVVKLLALRMINSEYELYNKIYTDGSKKENTCAIGIFYECDQIEYSAKLVRNVSIMTTELIAIEMAEEYIETNNISNAVILTDSKSACLYLLKSQKLKESCQLSQNIIRLAVKNNITIQWVPSHVNLTGNETADQLAKEGLKEETCIDNHILLNDMIIELKADKFNKFNNWYKSLGTKKGKSYMKYQPEVTEKPWFTNTTYSSREIRLLNRLKTGHNYSKSYLHNIGIEEDPYCDECGEGEDAEHLLIKCPKHQQIRQQLGLNKYNNMTEIIEKNDTKELKKLCEMEKKAKLSL